MFDARNTEMFDEPLFGIVKKSPIALTALLAAIIGIGLFFMSMTDRNIAEKDAATQAKFEHTDAKISRLEEEKKLQKQINSILGSKLEVLVRSFSDIPVSLTLIEGQYRTLIDSKILDDDLERSLRDTIERLAVNTKSIELSLEKTRILDDAFKGFLEANAGLNSNDPSKGRLGETILLGLADLGRLLTELGGPEMGNASAGQVDDLEEEFLKALDVFAEDEAIDLGIEAQAHTKELRMRLFSAQEAHANGSRKNEGIQLSIQYPYTPTEEDPAITLRRRIESAKYWLEAMATYDVLRKEPSDATDLNLPNNLPSPVQRQQ